MSARIRCESCRDRAALAADYSRHLEARGTLTLVAPPAWLEEALAAMPEEESEPASEPAPAAPTAPPSLGELVRRGREARGWTQRQVAEATGLRPRRVQRIELDLAVRSVADEELAALSRVLGLSLDTLEAAERAGRAEHKAMVTARKTAASDLGLGDLVRSVRLARGMRRIDLAQLAGHSLAWVGDLERGAIAAPYAEDVERLASALSIPLSQLTAASQHPLRVRPDARPRSVTRSRAEEFAKQLVEEGWDEAAAKSRAMQAYGLENAWEDDDEDDDTASPPAVAIDAQARLAWRRRLLEAAAASRPGAGGGA